MWPIFYVGTPTRQKQVSQKGNEEDVAAKQKPTQATISVQSTAPPSADSNPLLLNVTAPCPIGDLISPSEGDPRTSWIYKLRREDLQREMQKYGLGTDEPIEQLRRSFSKYWREIAGKKEVTSKVQQAAELNICPPQDSAYFGHMQLNEDIKIIKEMLNLPPNASSEMICRTINQLEKSARKNQPGSCVEEDLRRGDPFSLRYRTEGEQFNTGIKPTISGTTPRDLGERGRNVEASKSTMEFSSLCNIVRKWNIRFDGHRDPISFLERLEELIEAYEVDRNETLRALPEILTNTALLWYRNGKDSWPDYQSFRRSFELQFLPPGYLRNLDEEIRRRTQGDAEPFRSFVVALTTLMRRKGTLSLQERLDILYSNMRPEYKVTMRRHDFFSLEHMLQQAEHVESYMRERTLFQPPPPPEMALIPETAYHPTKKTSKQQINYRSNVSVVAKEVSKPGLGRDKSPKISRPETYNDNRYKNTPRTKPQSYTQTFHENNSSNRNDNLRHRVTFSKPTEMICWNCGGHGHLYRDCRLPKRFKCFYCKKEGVKTHECGCQRGNGVGTQWKGGH